MEDPEKEREEVKAEEVKEEEAEGTKEGLEKVKSKRKKVLDILTMD